MCAFSNGCGPLPKAPWEFSAFLIAVASLLQYTFTCGSKLREDLLIERLALEAQRLKRSSAATDAAEMQQAQVKKVLYKSLLKKNLTQHQAR